MSVTISLPRSIVEYVRKKARELGMSIEEYLTELLIQDLDPHDRAREYIESAKELLIQAHKELEEGDLRQAAEKLWGATALTVKAYAWWKESRKLSSHGELWEYKDKLVEELGEWVEDSWNAGNSMHICFYEGWCTKKSIEIALKRVEKLIQEVKAKIRS